MKRDRDAWLDERRSGIGGSDIAALLGLSPYRTPLDVWISKVYPVDQVPQRESEPMHWGALLEDVVAVEWSRRVGERIQRIGRMLRAPGREYAIATLDRAVLEPGRRAHVSRRTGRLEGARAVLEIKTASQFALEEWGSDDDPLIPPHYAAQGMWYCGVAELPRCEFGVLVGGSTFLRRTLERDEQVVERMFEVAARFWIENVERKVAPPPQTAGDVLKLWPRDIAPGIEAAPDLVRDVDALRHVVKAQAILEKEREDLERGIKLAIGPAGSLDLEGVPLVTWRAAKDRSDTNWQAVAADLHSRLSASDSEAPSLEDLAAAHQIKTPGSRRFIVRKA